MFSRGETVETEIGEFTEFITIPLMPCIFIVSAAASSGQLGDARTQMFIYSDYQEKRIQ